MSGDGLGSTVEPSCIFSGVRFLLQCKSEGDSGRSLLRNFFCLILPVSMSPPPSLAPFPKTTPVKKFFFWQAAPSMVLLSFRCLFVYECFAYPKTDQVPDGALILLPPPRVFFHRIDLHPPDFFGSPELGLSVGSAHFSSFRPEAPPSFGPVLPRRSRSPVDRISSLNIAPFFFVLLPAIE